MRLQRSAIQVSASLLGLALSVQLAVAASVDQKRIETEKQDVLIPLSTSKLEIETAADEAQRERANQPMGAFELGISSWQPEHLQPVSRISGASDFRLAGLPQMNFSMLEPLNRNLNVRAGAGLISLKRSGTLNVGQTSQQDQTAYVPTLRLGAEFMPTRVATPRVRPYLSLTLLPEAVVTSRSAFDNGEAKFGIGGELASGALIRVMNNFDLNLGVSATLGKIEASSLNGIGLSAGVRVPL